ncbi:MAG: peptidoglycan D,D-transpeptidase FtsI family protein [Solirubrobacteraceae bacterium]
MAIAQRRIGALFGLFFLLLAMAAARTLYLGALRGASLRQDGREQQLQYVQVPAQRGAITDRNGVDLAISEPVQDISADPLMLHEPLAAAQQLAPLLGVPLDTLLNELSKRTGFVYLARSLSSARAKKILALKIPGVSASGVMHRVYPRGALAAQVLGALGTEGNGLSGLEYSANKLLHGSAGSRRVVNDALGQPISISTVHQEIPGATLQLTLDSDIQQRTEDVLGAVGRVFHPKDATAIVMDPRSGSILAMASWPQLNLNDPSSINPETLENRAVSFDYEPGSTFKVVAVSGALQSGLINPETSFNVPDQIQVANRVIHDDAEHPEETLTVGQILAQSSNVGEIKIGALDGPDRFNEWVHHFGFGARSGTGLPGEELGQLLKPREYSGSSMGNLPIGQGELVTPIQMASAYAAIANGGVLRPPRIINQIAGKPVPQAPGRRILSSTTAAQIRQMLRGVLAPGGTASEVRVPGYQLAGKTGTASKIDRQTGEYSETAYVASFVGFAPASDPKLLCAVIVDEPQYGSIYGGTVAAPAFSQIMSFALPYLGITPG